MKFDWPVWVGYVESITYYTGVVFTGEDGDISSGDGARETGARCFPAFDGAGESLVMVFGVVEADAQVAEVESLSAHGFCEGGHRHAVVTSVGVGVELLVRVAAVARVRVLAMKLVMW